MDERDYPGDDHPVAAAAEEVIECAGDRDCSFYRGILTFQPEGLERVAERAKTTVPSHPAGYRDRHGTHYLPFSCGLSLAQAFAATEPQTVLDAVDADERQWSMKLREPGNHHLNSLLIDWRARWALIRQWAGHDAAVAAREERIRTLEELLRRTMWDLRQPNAEAERIANRIDRALRL